MVAPMPNIDFTEALFRQLKAALISLGADQSDFAALNHKGNREAAAFPRVFGEHMEVLERLCCQRDQTPVFAQLAGEMMCRAVIHCPDLRIVLERCCEFSAMIVGSSRCSRLVRQGDLVRFEIVSRYSTRDDAAMLNDLVGLHYHLALLSWLGDRLIEPDGVHLAYPRPDHPSPLLELFDCAVQFDAPCNALLFREPSLLRPVVRYADELESVIDGLPYNFIMKAMGHRRLSAQVRLLMADALRRGRAVPRESLLSRQMGVSVATLRRRLGREGTSYRQLRVSLLRNEAERLMQDQDRSLASIAQRLGFSDDRAFRRAYKRWTGTSPSTSPAYTARQGA